MSKREDKILRYAEPEPIESGVHTDIPRRLRMSSREIGVALVLTFAALLQLYWSLTRDGEKLTSAIPHLEPATVSRHAR